MVEEYDARVHKGQKSEWKDYKAIVSSAGILASFNQNDIIIDWANKQPLAKPVTCLGDGHDGVWNIFKEISSEHQRREILDWYHRTRKSSESRRFN